MWIADSYGAIEEAAKFYRERGLTASWVPLIRGTSVMVFRGEKKKRELP
jgi:hypothetical protein